MLQVLNYIYAYIFYIQKWKVESKILIDKVTVLKTKKNNEKNNQFLMCNMRDLERVHGT